MPNAVLQRLVSEREQINATIDQILDGANDDERELSDSERELVTRNRAELERLEPQINELLELEETRERAKDARGALTRPSRETETEGDDPKPPPAPPEGEQYRTFAQYARDELLVRFPYIGASVDSHTRAAAKQRLTRAVEQVLVGSVPGLMQPQYIAEIVGVINKSRPIVATSRQVGLASGKVQYPVIVNRPDVAEQVTEKTEVGDGAMQVNMTEVVAKTYLTAANFSWQTVQWSNPDALALWFDLAAESYAQKTDAAAAALIAAADATPTAVTANTIEAWTAAITGAAGAIYVATGRYANVIYADPVTAYELMGLASAVAPIFLSTGGGDLSSGQLPSIGGLRIVASKGLPADTAVVADSSALLTAETPGAPVELRAVEPSIGGIEVGIIGAFAASVMDATAFVELTPAA